MQLELSLPVKIERLGKLTRLAQVGHFGRCAEGIGTLTEVPWLRLWDESGPATSFRRMNGVFQSVSSQVTVTSFDSPPTWSI